MTKLAPGCKQPGITSESADQIIKRTIPLRTKLLPERGLILIESMTHRHRHLFTGPPYLVGDPDRPEQGIRDRFLGQNVEVVRQGRIDYLFVNRRRYHRRAEVGLDLS